ncbi:MAG: type II 3-dehydroquinate dehydratase [Atopobiaceae bacterium]|nr:type II 3-dehydroquinate dehydratase [Atopobiaceae bacterium]
MSNDDIAAAVLECVGGLSNVSCSSLCATRLRITLNEADRIEHNALNLINGVLGVAKRGANGIEVVFGPNLVRGVYQSFERLTGPMAERQDDSTDSTRPKVDSNFQVTITPETPGRPQVQIAVPRPTTDRAPVEDNETNALLEILDEVSSDSASPGIAGKQVSSVDDFDDGARLLVINGPSINMLGIREPEIYGSNDYSALLQECHDSAAEAGFAECECYQSNHEGDLIDRVQDAYELFDAIVINPGPYTHTSIALADALRAVGIPAIEVHLSDTKRREDYRRHSFVAEACIDLIEGMGIAGYRKAIFALARHLELDQLS